jgi:hypothetical protein
MAPGGAIPDEFICPISGDVMREPVWLDTGITVDKAYAEYYLQAGFRMCPVTGEHIHSVRLIPVSVPSPGPAPNPETRKPSNGIHRAKP